MSQFRNDASQNLALMPEILRIATIQELGYADSEFEPVVFEDILQIIHKMVTRSLAFAAECAKNSHINEIAVRDLVFYFQNVHNINLFGFGQRDIIPFKTDKKVL